MTDSTAPPPSPIPPAYRPRTGRDAPPPLRCDGCGADHTADLIPGPSTLWQTGAAVGVLADRVSGEPALALYQEDDRDPARSQHSVMSLEQAGKLAEMITGRLRRYRAWPPERPPAE